MSLGTKDMSVLGLGVSWHQWWRVIFMHTHAVACLGVFKPCYKSVSTPRKLEFGGTIVWSCIDKQAYSLLLPQLFVQSTITSLMCSNFKLDLFKIFLIKVDLIMSYRDWFDQYHRQILQEYVYKIIWSDVKIIFVRYFQHYLYSLLQIKCKR